MTDFIEVYDDALSSDDCKTVIKYINILPKRRVDKKGQKDVYYVKNTFIIEPSPYAMVIRNGLDRCVSRYVEKHHQLKRTDNSWSIDDSYCLQKYDPNMGYFISHA